ncbi:hypothetical protein QBC44DRAFT_359708 [Cladorrhinum sp. PSN332]|nr:hypothetical protein QBC44DRAFT_359708 [Cladorrhinum sp. PSN332]
MICSKSILAVMEGNHKCQGDAVVNTDIEAGNVQDDIDEDSNATAAHSNHSHGYAAAPAAKTTGAEEETTLDYQSAITAKIMANDTPSFNPVPLPMLNRDIVTDMLTSLNRTTPETVDEKHDLVVFKFMNFRTNIAKYHRNGENNPTCLFYPFTLVDRSSSPRDTHSSGAFHGPALQVLRYPIIPRPTNPPTFLPFHLIRTLRDKSTFCIEALPRDTALAILAPGRGMWGPRHFATAPSLARMSWSRSSAAAAPAMQHNVDFATTIPTTLVTREPFNNLWVGRTGKRLHEYTWPLNQGGNDVRFCLSAAGSHRQRRRRCQHPG